MLLLQHHEGLMLQRLSVIGIPSCYRQKLVSEMVKWELHSGPEWVVKRLKSLKIDLIRRRSGLQPLTWIRRNRRNQLRGVIGSLFRWSDKSDQSFEKCVQAFMAYSLYIFADLTDQQRTKFLSGVNPEDPKCHMSKRSLNEFFDYVSSRVNRRELCSPRPIVSYRGSPEKKAPSMFGRKSVFQSDFVLNDLHLFNTTGGITLFQDFQRIYDPLLKGLKRRDILASYQKHRDKQPCPVFGGEIHFLQEPGGKLRSIASPLRIHQEALRPLGLELYRLVQGLPWDCTHDQGKAIPAIQAALGSGKKVFSVDLSSATDLFPLDLQLMALRAVIKRKHWDHIDLFERISRGTWKSPIGWISWTKGQPLGLFPSFASFTLTHGFLLSYLGNGHLDDQFYVVGDDVIILDEQLYHRYRDILDLLNCPYSPDKSLESSKLAEFAGKIITPTRVIPQLKWRRMSDDSFLDLCRLLGRRSRCLLSNRQKRVYDQVAHLCEPLGLNQSLPGDNLAKMVERTLDFYQPDKAVLGSLMGLRGTVNTNIHSSVEETNPVELDQLLSTFDEKVKSALSKTIFSRWEIAKEIGLDGLSSLPETLGVSPRLPLKAVAAGRQSTLQRYERLLQYNMK